MFKLGSSQEDTAIRVARFDATGAQLGQLFDLPRTQVPLSEVSLMTLGSDRLIVGWTEADSAWYAIVCP